MAIITLAEAKAHLRIEDTSQDVPLQMMLDASEEFIYNLTGYTFDGTNNLAKIACLFLVQDLYDNRQITTDKVGDKIKQVVTMILTQLSLSYGGDADV